MYQNRQKIWREKGKITRNADEEVLLFQMQLHPIFFFIIFFREFVTQEMTTLT